MCTEHLVDTVACLLPLVELLHASGVYLVCVGLYLGDGLLCTLGDGYAGESQVLQYLALEPVVQLEQSGVYLHLSRLDNRDGLLAECVGEDGRLVGTEGEEEVLGTEQIVLCHIEDERCFSDKLELVHGQCVIDKLIHHCLDVGFVVPSEQVVPHDHGCGRIETGVPDACHRAVPHLG